MKKDKISNGVKGFFYRFWRNVGRTFWGYNLLWHFLAFILTYILVVSDFDWRYFIHTRNSFLLYLFFSAVILGGIVPLFGILIFYAFIRKTKNIKIKIATYALGQAALLGLLISSFYKTLSGRFHPPAIFSPDLTADTSQIFHFGFFREGIFWGWPSSHTTVAFAMALAFIYLFPKNKIIRFASILWAFYIGIGVSLTIHWFSDFVAGAIIGSVVGAVVGRVYYKCYFLNKTCEK